VCAAGRVEIGPHCLIGANATIVDSNFHPLAAAGRRYAPLPEPEPRDEIVIGANVFVGAGAYVLAGARIGDNSVVGAGAVVTGEVPPDSVVAGNPARVVRAL
jgi:acetyltransferase-like isoleucine patch superfamily enzyme